MLVYRITLLKYSNELLASGNEGRWNSRWKYVIYTASTRALACLENIVHRSGEGLNDLFKVMVIDIPDSLKINKLKRKKLPGNWKQTKSVTQKIGNEWLSAGKSAVLRVPSSVIEEEYVYILNPQHKDFEKIKLVKTGPFLFDERIKK